MYEVSVIVPIYNGEKYLRQTLDSLLDSELKNIQIILIDDGSTDNSGVICREYLQKRKNIYYEKKENGGIVSARNRGLEVATGEYICFCDQDDLVNKGMYSMMLKRIKDNESDVAICGTAQYINEKKIKFESFNDANYKGEAIKEEIIIPFIFNGSNFGKEPKEWHLGSIWRCMIRRSLIEQYGIKFRRYVNFEDDYIFFLDVVSKAAAVCTLSYVGYCWRINLKSESHNWKYVDDYEKKYKQFISDMVSILKKAGFSEGIIYNYIKYEKCHMLDELIVNEGSPYCKKKFLDKIRNIKLISYKEENRDAISFVVYIRPCLLRRKVTIFLLNKRLNTLAYIWSVNYKKLKNFMSMRYEIFLLERLYRDRIKKK